MKIKILLCLFLASSAAGSAQFLKIDYETNTPLPGGQFRYAGMGMFIDENTLLLDGEGYNEEICLIQTLDLKTGKNNKLVEEYFDRRGKKLYGKHVKVQVFSAGKADDGEHLFLVFINNSLYNSQGLLKLVGYKDDEFRIIKSLGDYGHLYMNDIKQSENGKYIAWNVFSVMSIIDIENLEHKSIDFSVIVDKKYNTMSDEFVVTNEGELIFILNIQNLSDYKSTYFLSRIKPFEEKNLKMRLLKYENANRLYSQTLRLTANQEYIVTSLTNNSRERRDEIQCFMAQNEKEDGIVPVISNFMKFKETATIYEPLVKESMPYGKDKIVQVITYGTHKGKDVVKGCIKVVTIDKDGNVNTLMESLRDIGGQKADVFLHANNENIYVFANMPANEKIETAEDLEQNPTATYKIKCYQFNAEGNRQVFTFDKPAESFLLSGHIASGNRVAIRIYDKGYGFKGPGTSPKDGFIVMSVE